MIKSKFYFFILCTIILSSCSDWESEVNIPNDQAVESDRIVLIEEFTGAKCVGCPAGSEEVERLLHLYPANLVAVAVHSNFLASPAKAGDSILITPEANAIESYIGTWSGKPQAAINRRKFADQSYRRISTTVSTWRGYVEKLLNEDQNAELSISRNFDTLTRVLKITLTGTLFKAHNGALHCHVGITESGIIAAQKSNSGLIDPYTHNHVLRKLLSPVEGDVLEANPQIGTPYSKTYSFVLPPKTTWWDEENCDIFAFVSGDKSNKEILQAAQIDVE